MATQKLQASRGLRVVPNDTIDIPNPGSRVATGTTTGVGTTANDVVDSAATFTSDVEVGDIVHNVTDGAIHTVSAVVDDNNLTLDAGSIGTGKVYNIYREGAGNGGCVVYVGGTGDVEVVTASGDEIIFSAVPVGMIIPVNIKRVKSGSTTATLINALF
jgi:hypothetical protein